MYISYLSVIWLLLWLLYRAKHHQDSELPVASDNGLYSQGLPLTVDNTTLLHNSYHICCPNPIYSTLAEGGAPI